MSRAYSCRCATLATACLMLVPPLQAQHSLPIFGDSSTTNPVERALQSRVSLEFGEQPIGQLVDALRDKFAINISIDHRALDDVGLGSDTPLPGFQYENMPLEQILTLVLEQLDLCLLVRHTVLVITTPEEAEDHLITHVYPVHDLITVSGAQTNPLWGADYDSLIVVITSTIAPDSWDDVGGAGAIEVHAISQSLVLSQTREVHQAVQALLAALRKAKNLQPPLPVSDLPPTGRPPGLPYGPGMNPGLDPWGNRAYPQPTYGGSFQGGSFQGGGFGGFF